MIDLWISTRGKLDSIKRIKAMRLHTTRYLCGHPLKSSAHVSLAINKSGLPKWKSLNLLIQGDKWDKRFLLTLLRASRGIDYVAQPDLSPITDTGTSNISGMLMQEVHMVTDMGIGKVGQPTGREPHRTTKAGPNTLAMMSSIIEIPLILGSPSMMANLKSIGGQSLIDTMSTLSGFQPLSGRENFQIKGNKSLMRKLSVIHDKEGKTRIIAIADYWTQSALKPLHDRIFSILKGIRTDMTRNQLGSKSVLPDSGPYHSLDLSSATDRFPVVIQEAVLAAMINPEYAKAWTQLTTGHEFYVPGEDRSIKYAVGQPMGLYSSGAVFALTHHIIVQVAALRCGMYPTEKYCLLGDDIVIADDRIAQMYKLIMAELGVELSDAKSHVSNDTWEFAKRGYHSGEEITGFPVEAFLTIKKGFLIANELQSGFARGNLDPLLSAPATYLSLLSELLGLGPQLLKRLYTKSKKFLLLPRLIAGEESTDLPLKWVIGQFFPPTCSTSLDDIRLLILSLVAEAKARVLEDGLRKTKDASDQFMKTAKNTLRSYSGSDAATALKALPMVVVAIKQHSQLNASIEDLRSYQGKFTDKELIFTTEAYTGFDPNRLFTTRASEVIQAANATLVNKLTSVVKDYLSLTSRLLLSNDDIHADRALVRKVLGPRALTPVMPGYPLVGGVPTDE